MNYDYQLAMTIVEYSTGFLLLMFLAMFTS